MRDGEHERVAHRGLVAAYQRARGMQAVDEVRRRPLEGFPRLGEPGGEGRCGLTSAAPSQASSARMRRENAGCDTWRCSAEREKLPLSARLRKSSAT